MNSGVGLPGLGLSIYLPAVRLWGRHRIAVPSPATLPLSTVMLPFTTTPVDPTDPTDPWTTSVNHHHHNGGSASRVAVLDPCSLRMLQNVLEQTCTDKHPKNPADRISYLCAWLALVPQGLCVAYATLIWSNREIEIMLMFTGQMACEALNWILKRWIKEERPRGKRHLGTLTCTASTRLDI